MRRLGRIIAYILWIAGLALLLYPFVSSWIHGNVSNEAFEHYQETVMTQQWQEELEAAERYNIGLSQKGNFFYDVFGDERPEELQDYNTLLNADEEGLIGFIQIPALSLVLPIYHGTSDAVLEKGCGHLEGSSLPVGGDSVHTVLCAHTGMEDAELFTKLDQITINEKFTIYVFGRELTYKIDEIKVVSPEAMGDLSFVENEDYVTLVTCTPYGINSHRLLVRGSRI